jgi:hypothetical protein
VPYQPTTLEWLAQNDEVTRFQTRGLLEGFQGNEPTIFLNNEISSSGVEGSRTKVKGRINLPKAQFGSKSCSET